MHIFIITFVHLLCMICTLGGLLAIQLALPASVRNTEAVARGVSKFGNMFIGIGFLAGAASYGMRHGHLLGAHYNGVIAMKFVILLAVGALLAMSKKPGKGDLFRNVCIALLLIAAICGFSLRLGVTA